MNLLRGRDPTLGRDAYLKRLVAQQTASQWTVIVAAALVSALVLVAELPRILRYLVDLHVYLAAATAMLHGADLYRILPAL